MSTEIQKKEYVVNVEQSGPFWEIYVPEIDYRTQAERIEQIETRARDLIETATGEPGESFTVYVMFDQLDSLA